MICQWKKCAKFGRAYLVDNSKKIVISLYDYTGEALIPWAKAGYTCLAYDIQHEEYGDAQVVWPDIDTFKGGGVIKYIHKDLHDVENLHKIYDSLVGKEVVFAMAFPVCTDLAVSGAAHFETKRKIDPDFQRKAADYAIWCEELFTALKVPFFIENPVSVLSSLWRKPDHKFHPFEYGGYIPEHLADHPKWPEYIPAKDAYRKKTCLWTGNDFQMPVQKPVECSAYYGNGYSKQIMKLGGKTQKTKNIRSATPRGFAIAVYEANKNKSKNLLTIMEGDT